MTLARVAYRPDVHRGRFVTSPRRHSQPPPRSIHTPWAPKHPCARPKSIPPTFGTPDKTVLPLTRNMSEILYGGKVCNFPKFQTSASQTETLFPLSSPPPSVSPFILRGRQNALSTSRETPASSVLHPIAPNPPPPSSITPEPVPRRHRPTQPQPQRPQGLSS